MFAQSVTSVDLEDFPIPTSERSARTAVIAYTASFFSGMPFQVTELAPSL